MAAMRSCSACNRSRASDKYSNSQWKKKTAQSRCNDCVAAGLEVDCSVAAKQKEIATALASVNLDDERSIQKAEDNAAKLAPKLARPQVAVLDAAVSKDEAAAALQAYYSPRSSENQQRAFVRRHHARLISFAAAQYSVHGA